ncbi:MAG: NAD(P)H-dependent oxidoreductase [Candidatus Magnetomorum sp.]|nr:NAD(P)H-dependent oxidoreductase [Candidatus Magnetomorum sp.]
MLVLGIQGSPREKGNTKALLSAFMDTAQKTGAETIVVNAYKTHIQPCIECGICEKNGFCSINDDMQNEIYPLLRRADIIVLASPIFFYNVTAPLKAFIDRSQTFWARKYRLNLEDPRRKFRKGLLLALGATKGQNLFQGTLATAKYFYDAVGATNAGALTYRKIEAPGDLQAHPTAISDAQNIAQELLTPFMKRKKVLFACRENACRSQIAAAFAHYYAGDTIEAICGGSQPVEAIHPDMEQVMNESGIDMGFIKPQSIETAIQHVQPDMIVTMGCGEDACPIIPGVQRLDWALDDPARQPIAMMRKTRDDIFNRVQDLAKEINCE